MVSLPKPLPERLAGIGVLGLALAWSLAAAFAGRELIASADLSLSAALMATIAGGTFAVAGVWFGIGAVVWAMARLLGGQGGFVRTLLAVSAAVMPMWLAAPAWQLAVEAGSSGVLRLALTVIGTLGSCAFLVIVTTTVAAVQGFSRSRAAMCVVLTALFCTSYLSL